MQTSFHYRGQNIPGILPSMEKHTNAPPSAIYLEATAPTISPAHDAGEGKPRPRTFSGVAYSGEPMSYYGERIIIDLASLLLPDPCPVLLQHDRGARVGVCTFTVMDGALHSQGRLLSSEAAQEVAADADSGFPWQLSVHAEPGSIEKIEAGVEVQVNGRQVTGPIIVYRITRIRELSFTPTGVDYRTQAHILSATYLPDHIEAISMPPDTTAIETKISDLTAQLSAAVARAETAETALAAQRKAARMTDVLATFAKLGRTVTDAETGIYLSLQDDAWAQVSRDLLASKPAAPEHLFREQATGEPNKSAEPMINLSAIYAARQGKVIQ